MKLQKQLTENAVSPVVGVILMIAVTFVLIGAIVLGLVFLTSRQLGLAEHFELLAIAYIATQLLRTTLSYYSTITATPTDYITFNQQEKYDDDNTLTMATVSLEFPDALDLALEQPYTVAPAHADPRDWAPVTQLGNEGTLRFVINQNTLPDAQENTYVPDKAYGPLNAKYSADEMKAVVVYDSTYDEVARFQIE